MSSIRVQNSNLTGEVASQKKLQGTVASKENLQGSLTSTNTLQGSIASQNSISGGITSRGNLQASVTPTAFLEAAVSKATPAASHEVDNYLSETSINPVQNKVVTEQFIAVEIKINNKADHSDIPTNMSQLNDDMGYALQRELLEYAKIIDIPSKVSQLNNDMGYISQRELSGYAKIIDIPTNVSQLDNDAGYLTEHQDLSDYAKKIDIPTNVSQFNNDAGYLTKHQDLSEYAKLVDIPTNVSSFTNDVGYLTEHQDLSEYAKIVDVPTKASQLDNDAGYLTRHQDLSAYAKLDDIPTNVSQLNNDAGYLTEHQSLNNYYDKTEINEKLDKKQDVIGDYVESINGHSGIVKLSASDVNALPDTTVIPTVPNMVSAFTNDADYASKAYVTEVASGKCKSYTFQTVTELEEWLNNPENTTKLNNGDVFYICEVGVPDYWWDAETSSKQVLETTKVDLTEYAKSADIPSNVSQLINDAKYLSESEVDAKLGRKQDKLTEYVSTINGKTGAVLITCSDIGAMPSDTVIPTVPTNVSAFTNDVGYLTKHQSLAGYAKTADIPTALSQLSQDATHRVVSDTEKATWNAKSNLSAANKGYNGAIIAGSDGVAEIGKYIDFHNTSTGVSDYSTRFMCTGEHGNVVNLPSISGTLVVGDKAYKLVTSSSDPTTNDKSVITVVI